MPKNIKFLIVTNHWGWKPQGIKTWVRYGWALFAKWTIERPSATCYKVLFFVLKITDGY